MKILFAAIALQLTRARIPLTGRIIRGFTLKLNSHRLLKLINILRHSRRFFRCACKALLPAAP
ncbi:hypothetical protein F3W26_15165 [Salmonella enterica]|nr:hypothetical protein [Salmonella enterica]